MAHRPLVLMSVGTRRPACRPIPTDRGVRKINDGNRPEIPPNRCPIIAWGWFRRPGAPRTGERMIAHRDEPTSGEGELAGAGGRRAQLSADVVAPAEHLVPDGGGGAAVPSGQL